MPAKDFQFNYFLQNYQHSKILKIKALTLGDASEDGIWGNSW
jgi:hypothetical protein